MALMNYQKKMKEEKTSGGLQPSSCLPFGKVPPFIPQGILVYAVAILTLLFLPPMFPRNIQPEEFILLRFTFLQVVHHVKQSHLGPSCAPCANLVLS